MIPIWRFEIIDISGLYIYKVKSCYAGPVHQGLGQTKTVWGGLGKVEIDPGKQIVYHTKQKNTREFVSANFAFLFVYLL